MTFAEANGAQHICRVLESRDVRHVFGLPGSQNAILFNELERSKIDPVVTTNEMSAGFAAMGCAVMTQRAAVMAIIGGPGFTYAITPLQEAKLDSVPIVCMVFVRSGDKTKSFRLQQMDYQSFAGSICKAVLDVSSLDGFAATLDQATTLAESGDPGPVLMVVESTLLEQPYVKSTSNPHEPEVANRSAPSRETISQLTELLDGQRILFYLGRGASKFTEQLTQLAEKVNATVLTTTSGRGTIDERHSQVLRSDLVPVATVNKLIKDFDRVLALGVRFSENGSRGYGLQFHEHQLVHVDSDADVLNANYPAHFSVQADLGDVLPALLAAPIEGKATSSAELDRWRQRFLEASDTSAEPRFQGLQPESASQFFSELQKLLPDQSVVVTDSGSHQMLCRKHWCVRSTNGLIVPTNFQSMGFAIPTAIGASVGLALAQPTRQVAAIIGDGGLQMSGLQLLAAIKRQLCLTVFVFNDGFFGHIRNQQLQYDGREAGTVLPELDLAAFCDAIGATYFDGSTDLMAATADALNYDRPAVVEVLLNDATLVRRMRTKATVKRMVKNSPLSAVLRWLRR